MQLALTIYPQLAAISCFQLDEVKKSASCSEYPLHKQTRWFRQDSAYFQSWGFIITLNIGIRSANFHHKILLTFFLNITIVYVAGIFPVAISVNC